MKTRFIEATTGPTGNWGKFLIGQFDAEEDAYAGQVDAPFTLGGVESSMIRRSLLKERGWFRSDAYFLMLDIETGEGAMFKPGGLAQADLEKHQIWVCPLFGPTLARLYAMWPFQLDELPPVLELTFEEAPFALYAPRNAGPRTVGALGIPFPVVGEIVQSLAMELVHRDDPDRELDQDELVEFLTSGDFDELGLWETQLGPSVDDIGNAFLNWRDRVKA